MSQRLKLIFAMMVVGSIGLFVHYIALPSATIAMFRAIIGSLFILGWIRYKGIAFDWQAIHQNWLWLLITGFAMGFNWIFLFEAYKWTTVSIATLCYYMAPVIIILLSPLVFKEHLTKGQIGLTLLAVVGVVFISGGLNGASPNHLKGIFYGLVAAVLYATIMICNKLVKNLDVMVKTFVQLAIAAVVMVGYVSQTSGLMNIKMDLTTFTLVLIIGALHTGFVYVWLFDSFDRLPSQTASLLTYVDPVTAIILSYLFLNQPMTHLQIVGMLLILGSTAVNELLKIKRLGINLINLVKIIVR
uniref:DMT family transporter n=1 Tax=Globicatella sulfidifaciens TaxID=136093 RepID=UPI0023F37E51|nr:DMT family transporter [Globicatella sulfidifaciens]